MNFKSFTDELQGFAPSVLVKARSDPMHTSFTEGLFKFSTRNSLTLLMHRLANRDAVLLLGNCILGYCNYSRSLPPHGGQEVLFIALFCWFCFFLLWEHSWTVRLEPPTLWTGLSPRVFWAHRVVSTPQLLVPSLPGNSERELEFQRSLCCQSQWSLPALHRTKPLGKVVVSPLSLILLNAGQSVEGKGIQALDQNKKTRM